MLLKRCTMKLGEIKLETLRLMFANYDTKLSIENFDVYANDEQYKHYLDNMDESISRAIDRINSAGVIPQKGLMVEYGNSVLGYESGKLFDRVDLRKLIDDYYALVRVMRYTESNVVGNVEYLSAADGNVLVKPLTDGEAYEFIYNPKSKGIVGLADNDELDLPDDLARIIPYFVKGDLYQDDEPNLAADAKNQFEQYLLTYRRGNDSVSERVESVYRVGI